MDYTKKGDEELTLAKDDSLRVFKRYNHWSYVRVSTLICKLVADSWDNRPSKRKRVTVVGFQ